MPRPRSVDRDTVGLRAAHTSSARVPPSPADPRGNGIDMIDHGPGMAWPLRTLLVRDEWWATRGVAGLGRGMPRPYLTLLGTGIIVRHSWFAA